MLQASHLFNQDFNEQMKWRKKGIWMSKSIFPISKKLEAFWTYLYSRAAGSRMQKKFWPRLPVLLVCSQLVSRRTTVHWYIYILYTIKYKVHVYDIWNIHGIVYTYICLFALNLSPGVQWTKVHYGFSPRGFSTKQWFNVDLQMCRATLLLLNWFAFWQKFPTLFGENFFYQLPKMFVYPMTSDLVQWRFESDRAGSDFMPPEYRWDSQNMEISVAGMKRGKWTNIYKSFCLKSPMQWRWSWKGLHRCIAMG